MSYRASVLCDSLSPDGVRLTTLEVVIPRIVLAEFNTHRTFSRNSASSRAIPVKKMLSKVWNDPFIPSYWGQTQAGMQAEQQLRGLRLWLTRQVWIKARIVSLAIAWCLLKLGLHKQLSNRLLEPWLWHTIIVTSTEWDNFFALRLDKSAQPEIRLSAQAMKDAIESSTPNYVDYAEWHLPLVNDLDELYAAGFSDEEIAYVSAGRCARVSYLTHDGVRDPKADILLAKRLQQAGHMSPFEHVARPMVVNDGERILRSFLRTSEAFVFDVDVTKVFSGNVRGWHQLRKSMLHEDNFMLRGN